MNGLPQQTAQCTRHHLWNITSFHRFITDGTLALNEINIQVVWDSSVKLSTWEEVTIPVFRAIKNSLCCCVMAQRYWILEYHWPPPFDGSLHAHCTSTEKLIFTLCNILHICIIAYSHYAMQPIAEQNTCCNANIAKCTRDPGVDCFNQITKLKNQITSP